jgi:hypothetical protein
MRLVSAVLVSSLFLGGIQEQSPPEKQDKEKPAEPVLNDLLGVNDAGLRNDEFARLKAMAERYGQSAQVLLQKRIDTLDAYCGLTEKQKRRLQVATRGAARTTGKRLLKDVEATAKIQDNKEARKKLSAISQEIDGLLRKPATSSFWKKTIETTLTGEQREGLKRNEEKRRAFERKVWVYKVVDETDRDVLLLSKQRQALLEALTKWIEKNPIPAVQRGRRSAWKWLPEDVVIGTLIPNFDEVRVRSLIGVAPYRLREPLQKKYLSE